jgi:nicotinate phosphoribosyltransferase
VRQLDAAGTAIRELVIDRPPTTADGGRPLLRQLVSHGEVVGAEPVQDARERHRAAVAELPPHARQLSRGYPAIATVFEPDHD